jgi:hypothetical protein
MDYLKKYHKYKRKYVHLKNQTGGTSLVNNNENSIFTIYTTGLYDSSNKNLINLWNSDVRDNIISLIPENFRIKFIHYDPLVVWNNDKAKFEKIENQGTITTIKSELEDILQKKDMENNRVTESIFTNEYFDINKINLEKPYIILDIAHLFLYENKVKTVKKLDRSDNIEYNINSVRFGYIGEGGIPLILAKSKLFEVNNNGQVITYIDKMINSGIKFNGIYPSDAIQNIYNEIIKQIKKNIFNFTGIKDTVDNDEIVKNCVSNIVKEFDNIRLIINYIWQNYKQEQIINTIVSKIVEENVEIILACNK